MTVTDELAAALTEAAEAHGATFSQVAELFRDSPAAVAVDAAPAEEYRTFTDQPVAVLGEVTTDNRVLMPDIELSSRACPLPLQWCEKNEGGHSNSVTIGVIEKLDIQDDKVLASGYLLNTADAEKAANLTAHGVTSPSLDLGKATYHYGNENGVKFETVMDLEDHVEKGGEVYRCITKGVIMGTTLVPFQAIGSAKLKLNDKRETRDIGLVASAAETFRPRVYRHELFEDPKLAGPTMPTMDTEGRIYGHLAVFGQCHRSVQSGCVMVPRSPSGYAHFHTSPPVRLDNGKSFPVGRLTVGTGHADPRLRPAPAAAHYDDTGACFALVRVGEDKHGIWFSGVAAPWATTEQIEQGLSAPLSGDWRNFGRGLDLVAALAVNTPGFAIQGRDDEEGRPVALVASVGPVPGRGVAPFSLADFRAVVREVFEEMGIKNRPLDASVISDGVIPAPDAPKVFHSIQVPDELASEKDAETPDNDTPDNDGKSPTEVADALLAEIAD